MPKKIADLTINNNPADTDIIPYSNGADATDRGLHIGTLRKPPVEGVVNVAGLKTREGQFDGEVVQLLGYNSEGDGGGSAVYWDEGATDDDDGGSVFQVTGVASGRWKRALKDSVHVAMFGAMGSGQQTDRIQKAVTFCANSPAVHRLEFSPITYDITPLSGTSNVSISQSSMDRLTLIGNGATLASSATILRVFDFVTADYLEVSGFNLTHTEGTFVSYRNVKAGRIAENNLNGVSLCLLREPGGSVDPSETTDNIIIEQNHTDGNGTFNVVDLQKTTNIIIRLNTFKNTGEVGVKLSGLAPYVGRIWIYLNEFSGGTSNAIDCYNAGQDVYIENNKFYDIDADNGAVMTKQVGGVDPEHEVAKRTHIKGNLFHNVLWPIKIEGTSSLWVCDNNFLECGEDPMETTFPAGLIDILGTADNIGLFIENNVFEECTNTSHLIQFRPGARQNIATVRGNVMIGNTAPGGWVALQRTTSEPMSLYLFEDNTLIADAADDTESAFFCSLTENQESHDFVRFVGNIVDRFYSAFYVFGADGNTRLEFMRNSVFNMTGVTFRILRILNGTPGSVAIHLNSWNLPQSGQTADRPGEHQYQGQTFYNDQTNKLQYWDGSAWQDVGIAT